MRRASAPDPAADALAERLRARPWRLLQTPAAPGTLNMARDSALQAFAAAERTAPLLRVYTWMPACVSLGHFQDPAGIDLDYARRRGWDIVRRPTGGRGILHQWELTYAVVLPPSVLAGAGVRTSYTVLTERLNSGLRSLLENAGIAAPPASPAPCSAARSHEANCFALASECDTLVESGKLVGSAQVRKEGALLQHGSILLDAEPEAWARLFGSPGRLATLRALLGVAVEPRRVTEALVRGFERFGIRFEPSTLTEEEARTAGALAGRFRV
jgi:lipoyl(octanoyl) transferase